MIKLEMSKLVRKFFLLAMLIGCLTVLTNNFSGNKVSAAGCCTVCDSVYDSCIELCDIRGGKPACYQACDTRYGRCYATCDPNC